MQARSRFFCFLIILWSFAITLSPAYAATSFTDLLSRERPAATHRLAYGSEPDQFGELWLPDTQGPYPVIVMIHGGCWQESLPGLELMGYIADDLRHSGVAVWNIEYRRLGGQGGGYPGTFLDTGNGVDYLRQIAAPYHLDLSRLVIVGHSAGGHLGLWAAARHKIAPDSALYKKDPLPVKAAVTLAGINDLAAYRDHGAGICGEPYVIDDLVIAADHNGPAAYQDTSPAAMLPLGIEQLIVSGDKDIIVPAVFGNAYAAAAQKAGDQAEAITIPGAGHFELIDPQSKVWQEIKQKILERLQ